MFVPAAEHRRAKRITTLWEVKESNPAIKKEVIARKVALNASVNGDDKDEEMSGKSGPKKNKNIPLCGGLGTSSSNLIHIDADDLDLDAERQAYERVLISCSHN